MVQTGDLLVSDQLSILFGSTSRRQRFPRLQAITLSHSHTLLDRNRWQLSRVTRDPWKSILREALKES